ncbi:GDSL-like Lipase/Acylhydrolase [Musa troglodytarum]|uniref:GDSL-like Lipase/Acylhydrolase n=1 Tax=Musa troglodytarum TaxID=320322 RepID=A0A9E7K168_9LILI|nr:GDSL-like Lipase/Acylhydrolase [Musa troglodytarum]
MVGPGRPVFVLFGSSIVQFSYSNDGWGAILADVYARKDAAVQPSLVIVYFGGNDSMGPHPSGLGPHVPLPEYIENMRKIATHLKGLSETTRVIFLSSPPLNEEMLRRLRSSVLSELVRTNERCQRYSEACMELCKEMDVKVVDLYNAIQKREDWSTACFTDGVHLSSEGSKIVVEEILKGNAVGLEITSILSTKEVVSRMRSNVKSTWFLSGLAMFCGTASFKNIDDDAPTPSSPMASKKKASKNPYSTRGLDKFSTVLGDLEARRRKIMEKAGPQGAVSMVKFMYSNSTDWIPVVVRRRDRQDDDAKVPIVSGGVEEAAPAMGRAKAVPEEKVKSRLAWGAAEEVKGWVRRNWRGSYYWPLVVLVALVCLVMFGRVFAICCMLVWWYLMPVVHGEGGDVRRYVNKINNHGRRISNTRISATSMVPHSSHSKKTGGVQV